MGDVFMNKDRLTGVVATESGCLLWWAGERHALVSFSPRMRRPSLTGLNWIEVDCMLERALRPRVCRRGGCRAVSRSRKKDTSGGGSGAGDLVVHANNANNTTRKATIKDRRGRSKCEKEDLESKGVPNTKRSRQSRIVSRYLTSLV